MSVGLSALVVLLSLVEGNQAITNGLIIGTLTGLTFYLTTWWCIGQIVRSDKDAKPNPILAVLAVKVFFLKFPLLGVALWYAFKHLPISPIALVCGIAVTQIPTVAVAVTKFFKQ